MSGARGVSGWPGEGLEVECTVRALPLTLNLCNLRYVHRAPLCRWSGWTWRRGLRGWVLTLLTPPQEANRRRELELMGVLRVPRLAGWWGEGKDVATSARPPAEPARHSG